MSHKKINRSSEFKKAIFATFIIAVIVFILILVKNQLHNSPKMLGKVSTKSSLNHSDNVTIYITPTILPSNNKDKLIFKHPLKHFSFEYPTTWNIIITKRTDMEDWYYVMLTDSTGNDNFRINFMNDARGAPYYEYQTNEEKVINGRTINWNIMYKDNKAFEAVISFPNNDFGHNLIGLYIYLPKENQEQFIKQVEEIIASLK